MSREDISDCRTHQKLTSVNLATVFHIEQYIPEPLYPHYEKLRDSILMGLIKIGVISSDAEDKTNPGGGRKSAIVS